MPGGACCISRPGAAALCRNTSITRSRTCAPGRKTSNGAWIPPPPARWENLDLRMQTAQARGRAGPDDRPEAGGRLHVPAQPDRPGGTAVHVQRSARGDRRLHADLVYPGRRGDRAPPAARDPRRDLPGRGHLLQSRLPDLAAHDEAFPVPLLPAADQPTPNAARSTQPATCTSRSTPTASPPR